MMLRKIRRAVTGSVDGSLAGLGIGVLGLTFKAGTGDLRDSPAVAVARQLCYHGATVTAYDPCVPGSTPGLDPIRVVDDPYAVARDAAAIVILTEWPEFRALDWVRLGTDAGRAVVVDTRNLLDKHVLSHIGFAWVGNGIGTEAPVAAREWDHRNGRR
ncbi:UDP binding domain-containing protein [Nocardia brevicatena]|uniref:UDP binding domain-containing protein n=1 Tax=Nocardia brevicatena TaxID=37327 RepID=UPI0003107926|nr:UDP binding domain-containing protein [Nocardia brevicatena]